MAGRLHCAIYIYNMTAATLNIDSMRLSNSVYSSPLSLGGSKSVGGVWVGSGRFEPKEHRRRKDRATFVDWCWEGVSPSLAD